MPKTRPLTEAGRRRERNKKRDNALRACLGAYSAAFGVTYKSISEQAGMAYRTLKKRLQYPETLSACEMRNINDILPDGYKIPAEVIGS